MTDKLSRRDVLQKSAAFGALAVFGASACSKSPPPPLNCSDTTGLASGDVQIRATLGYVDTSTQPGKSCAVCSQFKPAAPNACGGCAIVKGPINPGGYCKSFQPKAT
jgi:hypothetical protein